MYLHKSNPQSNHAVRKIGRLSKAFLTTTFQDVHMAQDLTEVSDEILTVPEKERLQAVRRRPLLILCWIQAELTHLTVAGLASERLVTRCAAAHAPLPRAR